MDYNELSTSVIIDNADTTFSADDVVNTDLYAKTSVNAYLLPSTSSGIIKTFLTGQFVGNVYSYVIKPDALYWQIKDDDGDYFYVSHKTGKFSATALADQGVLTVKEKKKKKEEEEKANQPITEQLKGMFLNFAGTTKWILIAALVLILLLVINKFFPLGKLLKK
jgi:hypothetical protein